MDIERMQVEVVFGLGGGELAGPPSSEFPDEWDSIQFWYEGVPSYTSEFEDKDRETCKACNGDGYMGLHEDEDEDECPECNGDGDFDYELRTMLVCRMYGREDVPEGWEELGNFRNSGEAECWHCGPGTDWEGSEKQKLAREKEPNTNTCYRGDPSCKLCKGGGYVYIGDGWFEVVYRKRW